MTKFTIVSAAQGLSILTVLASLAACAEAPEPAQKPEKTTKGGSSGSSGAGAGTGAGTGSGTGTETETDAKPTEPTAPATEACSVAGDKGNTIGVGKYCSKTVDDCDNGTFCQAAFAPEGAQFCTKLCTADSQCGDDAVCFKEDRGSACVPNKCLDK